ncbi:hypothetical protein V3C99_015179 [Haemonchus contortus]
MLRHVEKCKEVSYVLSTGGLLAAGLLDSDADLGRPGWVNDSDPRDFTGKISGLYVCRLAVKFNVIYVCN